MKLTGREKRMVVGKCEKRKEGDDDEGSLGSEERER